MAKKIRNRANGENTVIGAGTIVGGSIVSDATVIRIDGKVNGGVETKGDLIVGPDGEVLGDVKAFSLILAGTVMGNANIEQRIEIEAGGKLIGDIETEILAMDETAMYQGKVTMRGLNEKTDNGEEAKENE